jgi:hypothetical protein
MGLIVGVYRNPLGDFTGSGISGRHLKLTVVNVDGPFDPTPDAPAVALLDGPLGTKRIVPVLGDNDEGWQMVEPDGYCGPMMGGNYAATSDGRWSRAVGFYGAVAIHDRYETWEQYRALSSD